MNTNGRISREQSKKQVMEYLANKKKSYEAEAHNRDTNCEKSEIISLPVHKLTLANTSQRALTRLADDIAKNFNKALFNPIIVSERDGKYYVVDGQHRLYAAKKKFGDDYLMECKIIRGLTLEEEADLFVKLNTCSKPLQYADKAKGMYYANDETMVNLYRICKNNGVELGLDNDKRATTDGRITAIKAIVDTYNKIGAKQTDRLVRLLNDTWDGKSVAFKQEMIKATGVILSLYSKELDDKRFVKKFSKIDPKTLISVARNDDATKTKTENKLARIMIQNYYNKGKGAKPLEYRFGF